MSKFLNNINLEAGNDIQFKTTAGSNAGKIEQVGDNLVLSNAIGDVLLGDGASDVYIGDGTNNVDIVFEQSGSIRGDGSAITLTIGGSNTTLNLENPNVNGNLSLDSKLTLGTSNGYILFDYEPTTAAGEYTSEVPLLRVDRSGSELTILSRLSNNGAIALGNDDTVAIIAGDTKGAIKDNIDYAAEKVVFAAEGGFHAYGFPSNDTTWSNRNEFRFRSDSGTASDNGLYIGDGGSTQFIDLSRNLKNIGTISAGAITSSSSVTATSFVKSGGTSSQFLKANGNVDGTAYAPLASPALTGTPTAPTAAANTNTAQIATTAYVQTELSDLIGGAPTALDTLNELAAAINDDSAFSSTVTTALGNRLRIDINNQGLTSTQQGYGRTNLGLGTAATSASTAFATAAQGTSAETAYGWGDHSSAGYLTTSAAASTYSVIAGSTSLTTAGVLTVDRINMRDAGDYITFHGDDTDYHAIGGRNSLGSVADDIRINSYGAVYINLDSNNNNSDSAAFRIGRHGGNATISDWLFTVDGENGNVTVAGTVDGRDLATDGSKLDGIATNANNYSLPLAASGTRGGVQIGYAENGQNYPVELSSEKMFVNVPWTDNNTTYSAGNGIGLSGTTFSVAAGGGLSQDATGLSHSDTSTQASVNNTGGTVIQDITLDTYGHITALSSQDLDGRYYTESEVNTLITRGYANGQAQSATGLTNGAWYTIASNTGDRAIARFGLRDSSSGDHQSVIFYAAHNFGTNASSTITVLHNSNYSGSPFRYIRIKDGGTYDGAVLQVYVDTSHGASDTISVYLLGDNFQGSGWELVDWLDDATAPSGVSNYSSFGETGKIDLDQIAQGGIATTGPIYGDGDTTQYRMFNDNYHPNADKLTTARNIALTGAVTGNTNFDGSGNISIATTATSDPTLTLAGDASGSATFTNLGNATLTVSVADNSHYHTIENVTNLQSSLDAKQAAGTYNTIIGTDTDISYSGATVLSAMTMTDGVIQSHSSRTLTLADLGYTGATNANNYSLPLATSSVRGGVKIGYTENAKNYPVELSSTEQMFVNVPWTDTTYTLASFGVSASSTELNRLDGITATTTELNYTDGVTSNIQTQLNGKSSTSHNHTLDSLSNTTITSNTSGEILRWNGAAWANATLAEAGIATSSHNHDTLYLREDDIWQQTGRIFTPQCTPLFYNSSGTAGTLQAVCFSRTEVTSTANAWAQACLNRTITNEISWSGGGIEFAREIGVSFKCGFLASGTQAQSIRYMVGGRANNVQAAGNNPLVSRGFGVEIRSRTGTTLEWRVIAHNGTSFTGGTWTDIPANATSVYTKELYIYSDGSGNIEAGIDDRGGDGSSWTTKSITGGPTANGNSTYPYICHEVVNAASGSSYARARVYDYKVFSE